MSNLRSMKVQSVQDEEIVEKSIFGENQFDEMIDWIIDRQNMELNVEVTGKWVDTNEFFKGKGKILKKYDGTIFPSELYILLSEGDLGKENILIGRRIIRIKRPTPPISFEKIKKLKRKIEKEDIPTIEESLQLNLISIENRFKKDIQNRVFFRSDTDYEKCIDWIESFLKKYEISTHIEGVLVSEEKIKDTIVTGTVESIGKEEFFVQIWDAFDPNNPLDDDTKEFLTKDWHIQVSKTGINKIHPKYILVEIGEELALTKRVLDVKNVKVVLGGRTIIHDVNFQIEKGQILGIIGESGAGKTTTLKAILGEFGFEGQITVFGIDARNTKAIAPFIGYVPQDLSRMYPNFNALENIVTFGRQYGIPDDVLIQRGKKILKDLGIEHVANQPVKSLSGGQKRRVSIAISMVHNPYLIFLDEPTSGLDPLARYELWDYLDIINKQYGITLCVISHYLDEIEYCDTACIFLRGIGFYDWNSPDGLKKKLPGKGTAIEITLEQVSVEAVEILRKIKDVSFVIQRGERIRVLSDTDLNKLGDKILDTLRKHKLEIHSIEYKVEIDMVDYFTYVSILHNTNDVNENTGEITHASEDDMKKKQAEMGAKPLKFVKGYIKKNGKPKELVVKLVDEQDMNDEDKALYEQLKKPLNEDSENSDESNQSEKDE